LSADEAAAYEAIMNQRDRITADWFCGSAAVTRIAEERLWLHRGIRPLLSGRIDELVVQGNRALLFDLKSGQARVDDPAVNVQLRIYAMLAWIRWPELESVTVAVRRLSTSTRRTPFQLATWRQSATRSLPL
jgi:hypothetical protein